eukprot:TRINITY_DN4405_c0_g1_i1.p1 TRINITY_DN4405_c0_g1~~TRINITY_DN4405_c0_g1_i1.p1  ORF type:complete len:377 (+),score=37.55 TRINITY_DN4405_c0_g1_i1:124-1131(+)
MPATLTSTLLEQSLLSLWCDVLEQPFLTSTSNFFEVGGTSLSAVKLVRRSQHVLGLEITVRDLFSYPTVAALATYATAAVPPPPVMPVVTIATSRDEQAAPPLILFPPAGGTGFVYLGLRTFFTNRTVLAITNPDFGCECWRFKHLDEMAAYYCELVQAQKLTPPLILGGYSFGGHIALLVAALLEKAGIKVARVLLWDSMIIPEVAETKIDAALDQDAVFEQEAIPQDSELAQSVRRELRQTREFSAFLRKPGYPPRLLCPITLFKCSRVSVDFLDPSVHQLVRSLHSDARNGFSESLPQLQLAELDCEHGDIFEPKQLSATMASLDTELSSPM